MQKIDHNHLSHKFNANSHAEAKTRIITNSVSNGSNNHHKKHNNDPLMKYPLRFMAYANEVGAALSPISASLATALWVPALMYFGADIYDKYKNNENGYDPSTKRGLNQAIFQALASVLLPTSAVRIGQSIASNMKNLDKTGLSPQTQKEINEFIINSIKENRLSDNTSETLKKTLKTNFQNKLNNLVPEMKNEKITQKLSRLLFDTSEPIHALKADKTKVFDFLDNKISEIYKIRENLLENKKIPEVSEKAYKYFSNKLVALKEMYPDNYQAKAAKSTISKILKQQNFKINLPATVGGFIALALAAIPIDIFVEKFVIKKIVSPSLDYISNFGKSPDKK